jgi:hypothetical protein
LRERFQDNEAKRQELIRLTSQLDRQNRLPIDRIDDHKLVEFSGAVRTRLRDGAPAFRRGYLRLFVDRIEADDNEIRILEPKSWLVRGLAVGLDPADGPVPIFAQEWRAVGDESGHWSHAIKLPAYYRCHTLIGATLARIL